MMDSIKNGALAIIPTDTIYGLVASALLPEAVENLYAIRGRDENKPCIILIADISELEKFGITPTPRQKEILAKLWPGTFSVILPCVNPKFAYLHRGMNSLAFRVPAKATLQALLQTTGPLLAPSANPQGEPTARNIKEAQSYFGDRIKIYLDGGEISGQPSTLLEFNGDKIKILRQGAGLVPVNL